MTTVVRSLSGIFCDDMREEILGKRSLIGCYSSNMLVSKFPITLPKLCIYALLQTSGDRPFREVRLVVLKDEEQLAEGSLPLRDAAEALAGDATQMIKTEVHFIFAPLTIDGPCSLRVRANVDGEEIRGLALEIKAAPIDWAESPAAKLAEL